MKKDWLIIPLLVAILVACPSPVTPPPPAPPPPAPPPPAATNSVSFSSPSSDYTGLTTDFVNPAKSEYGSLGLEATITIDGTVREFTIVPGRTPGSNGGSQIEVGSTYNIGTQRYESRVYYSELTAGKSISWFATSGSITIIEFGQGKVKLKFNDVRLAPSGNGTGSGTVILTGVISGIDPFYIP